MSVKSLEEIRARIHRLHDGLLKPNAASGYEQKYFFKDGTKSHLMVNGIKSPEQLEDELLGLYVWVWSLKDYLKEAFESCGLDPRHIEEIVNKNLSLQYVSDIANTAKHSKLNSSRSGKFAKLAIIKLEIPQSSISKISCGAFDITLDTKNPEHVRFYASVILSDESALDAFEVLSIAINEFEEVASKVLSTR